MKWNKAGNGLKRHEKRKKAEAYNIQSLDTGETVLHWKEGEITGCLNMDRKFASTDQGNEHQEG